MGLTVIVSRAANPEPLTIPTRIASICASVVETDDHIAYTPLPGKLVELLTYFNRTGLMYQLQDDSVYR
jgi:hypothetical protein